MIHLWIHSTWDISILSTKLCRPSVILQYLNTLDCVVPGELDSGSAALNFLSKRPSLIQEVTIDVTL